MENVSTERPSWHMPFAGFSLFVVLLSAVFYTVVTHQGENASNMAWVVYGALMFYVFCILSTFIAHANMKKRKESIYAMWTVITALGCALNSLTLHAWSLMHPFWLILTAISVAILVGEGLLMTTTQKR
ncbi:MAG: hypothetical protein VXY83_03690 [Pseudomonadota bacterium]|nr:hypothetical protein [Magnetococcales bacterium]MEC8067465.1 hypothetical protein [Pseudomonadota bacterium]MEC8467440.1 hypothetical protein [Pseudomonadota bacterium]|tara:strand:- start:2771 stop:3157 length:387 start_codon:yes stop_codon:yes gene_type:complete